MGVRLHKFGAVFLILAHLLTHGVMAEPLGPELPENPEIVISEIQTAEEEFIELYNGQDSPVQLDAWRLEYRAASKTSGWTTKTPTPLVGEIKPKSFYLIALSSYLPERGAELTTTLSNTGGHTRLIRPAPGGNGEFVVDLVGWGNAEEPEGFVATAPKAGLSIQRCFAQDVFVDSNNNADDFLELDKTPGAGATCPEPPVEELPPLGDTSCSGIVISEILPNATGADAGQEFIELYNPTGDFIDLAGCGLQLAGEQHIHRFDSQTLTPGEYRTFSDIQTGITLPNSSGGTVYLLSSADEELQAVGYPGGLDEQASWAWFGADDWRQTFAPSPNGANIAEMTEPCPGGQELNPESGRCVNTSTSSSELKPCDPGQERNPDTNRCRTTTTSATLAACKPGQVRNPETNRCRAVASVASQLKPCAPGQERNAETNRCRKVAGSVAGSDTDVKDITSPASISANWWLAGVAATGAIGYGLWEWRRDIVGFVSRLSRKATSTAQ